MNRLKNAVPTPAAVRSQAMQEYDRRTAQEKRIVKVLCAALDAAGFWVESVWDGGEYIKCRTAKAAMDVVFGDYATNCTIHFDRGPKGSGKKSHGVYIVCGNGDACISDWHCGDKSFDRIVSAISSITEEL